MPIQVDLKSLPAKKQHHRNGRFINPFTSFQHGNLKMVLSWKLFGKNRFKSDYANEKYQPVNIDWRPVCNHNGLSVTFLKHASIVINDHGTCFYVDPVFSRSLWYIRDFTPLKPTRMPKADYILVTHGHYDHFDIPTISVLGKGAKIISPLGYSHLLAQSGHFRHTELDWFDMVETKHQQIVLLPCNHWTMRNPLIGPNRSLWGSYLLRTKSGYTIFIAGDTAYFNGFAQIGQQFDIDLAIFNLGAYEPRWFMKNSHMNPAETVTAMTDLNARKIMIVHWGTFRLGDEPVHFPPIQLEDTLRQKGLISRWIRINHGNTFYIL